MKTLTIAVPSYNVEKYIEKALKSFVSEEIINDIEVLIINDGSSDRTEEIATKFQEYYPNTFKVLNKENGGHGSTINRAIKEATGKYFRVVDADDWVNTNAHINTIKYLKECTVDLVLTDYMIVNMITGEEQESKYIFLEPKKIYNIEDFIFKNNNIGMAQIHYKTQILKSNNIHLLENTFFVDYEFTTFPFAYVKTVAYLNETVYYVLTANDNQSTSINNMVKRVDHLERVSKSLINFISDSKISGNRFTYCIEKAKLIIYSYLLVTLVYNEDKKLGRNQAKKMKEYVISLNPMLWNMVEKKYLGYLLVNLSHLDIKIYNILKKTIK